ncbi:hypothetical protein BC828DRAFT_388788 [Blastocladiella britannica]|nr:hypothetical protein BC828DRAFT_388788 [Blastocladiella britannica]
MGKAKQKGAIRYKPTTPWEQAKHEKELERKKTAQSSPATVVTGKNSAKAAGKKGKKSNDDVDMDDAMDVETTPAPTTWTLGAASASNEWEDDVSEVPSSSAKKPTGGINSVKQKTIKKKKLSQRAQIVREKLETRKEKETMREIKKIKRKTLWD